MVSGFSTSPYDQDRMVLGEAKLIRSAVRPLVSTCTLLSRKNYTRARLCTAYSRLVRETNKCKRFESFLSSACGVLLVFYIQRLNYTQNGGMSQVPYVNVRLESLRSSRSST